ASLFANEAPAEERTQAAPGDIFVAGRSPPRGSVEDLLAPLLRDPRPIVRDLDLGGAVAGLDRDPDRRSLRRERGRVVEPLADRFGEPLPVDLCRAAGGRAHAERGPLRLRLVSRLATLRRTCRRAWQQ